MNDISSVAIPLGLAGVVLATALLLFVRTFRVAQARWAKVAAAVALLLALLATGTEWTLLPHATAERLIANLRDGRTEEVETKIAAPAVWRYAADGSLEIFAEDGTRATVTPDCLPLLPFGYGVRRSVRDLVEGRKDFQLATRTRPACRIDCTAERLRVRCRHVENFKP